MLTFLNQYSKNIHSQNGEDGITLEVCRRLSLTTGHAVETGGNDGLWMSNTRLLLDNGWSGLFVEADYGLHLASKRHWAHNPKVRHQCSKVDGNNINAFVTEDIELLSLDTDGRDYQIFHGLRVKPKIVIVEIDSSIPPDQLGFNADGGAGFTEMLRLGLLRGYFLLAHTGNMVFVANEYRELFPEIEGDGLTNSELYFKRDWVKEEVAA